MDKRQYKRDNVAYLFDCGATLFLCKGDKSPLKKGWKVMAYGSPDNLMADYENTAAARFIGMIPASVGLLAIDVDEGPAEYIVEVLRANDVDCLSHETGRGHHVWIRTDARKGNQKWGNAHAKGDIRSAAGYVVLWNMDTVIESLELAPSNADMVLKLITETYQVGERNNELFKDAMKALRSSKPLEKAKDKALLSGLPMDEVERTLDSAKETFEASAKQAGRLGTYPAVDEESLSLALTALGFEWRYDVRGQRIQVRNRDPEKGMPDYEALTDLFVAALQYTLHKRFSVIAGDDTKPYRIGESKFYQFMNALCYGRQVDPLLEWIHGLPAWDGQDRIDGFLQLWFGAPDDDLTRWAARYLFVGPIQRASDPGCELDELPVFTGAQGIGKSKLLRWLFPEPLQNEWFSDSLELAGDPRRQIEALEGKVMVEISEMSGASLHNIERVKSFVSRQTDTMRGAYQRNASVRPRRCVFVATSNDRQPLPNDSSGNRRFVVVPFTESIRVQDVLPATREQLFAEALVLFKRGVVANLPHGMRGLAGDRGEVYRYTDSSIEEGLETLPLLPSTLTEVGSHLDMERMTRGESNRIRKALEQRGWIYKSVRMTVAGKEVVRKRWTPPIDQHPLGM